MLRFRIFPTEDGKGYDVDVAGDPKDRPAGAPFSTTGEARRAVRKLQRAIGSAPIQLLDACPDDVNDFGSY